MTSAELSPPPQQSFLVADCGSTNTTVALFDIADGSYRLVARANARTTIAAPWSDIVTGIQHAITELTEMTGRTFLSSTGTLLRPSRPDGTGVDHFAATISAAPALETVIVGLFNEVSLASARRALGPVYAHEVDCFSQADARSEELLVATLIQQQPDLVFLVGGTDGGAEERIIRLAETVSVGVDALIAYKRPQVLFAGNIKLRERVRELFSNGANLQVAGNVRPRLDVENLDETSQIARELYEDIKMNALPGIQEVHEWSSYPLRPTADAYAAVVEYLATARKGRVLGVDLGSNSTTLAAATPGTANLVVHADLGMGRPALNLLNRRCFSEITTWMPTEISDDELRSFLLDKSLTPETIPTTETELSLELAVARKVLGCAMVEAMSQWNWAHGSAATNLDLLVARGSALVNTPRPSQALLTLLDALQPTGIFAAALDRQGVLPALGILARHEPLVVVQALDSGVLTDLGWVIAPVGKGQPGQKVIQISMETERNERLKVEVEYGSIEVLPLPPGQSAKLDIKPARRFDIGFGPGQGKKLTVHGGLVGLVIDARGRPIELPRDDHARRSLLRQWQWDMG